MKLANTTALITGAARGIGQVTACELARAGANIVGVDLFEQGLAETGDKVEALGRRFQSFACDLTDAVAVKKMIDTAAQTGAGFDILINNAGVAPCGAFTGRAFDEWVKTIDINLLSLMRITYFALPYLAKRENAHIVNIASIAGKFGGEGLAAYAASKHGVVGFSSALRAELAEQNIGVSWLCPSYVRTRISEDIGRTFMTPMVEPEQVARAIRRAIAKNHSEVFVPRYMRLSVDILPAVFPNFSRKISKWTKVAQGWLQAEKKLQL